MLGGLSRARLRRLGAGAAAGTLVGILAALVALIRPELLERAELRAYDVRVAGAASSRPASDIVMVDITEDDIASAEQSFGVTWPWPRAMYGYLTGYATRAKARAIAFDLLFIDRSLYSAADDDELAAAMRDSGRAVIGLQLGDRAISRNEAEGRWAARIGDYADRAEAEAAAVKLLGWNVRTYLVPEKGRVALYAGGMRSADAVLSTWDRLSGDAEIAAVLGDAAPEPRELDDAEAAKQLSIDDIIRERDSLPDAPGEAVPERDGMRPPLAAIGAAPAHTGSVSHTPDVDGVMRRYDPLVRHRGRLYPSLALAAMMAAQPDLEPRLEGGALHLGERTIPLGADGRMLLLFHDRARYPHVSAFEVLRSQALIDEGKPPSVPPEAFADKYVIVSLAGLGLRDIKASPVAKLHPGAEINANALDNLLRGRAVVRSSAAADAALVLLLSVFAAVAVVLVWSSIRRVGLALAATAALVAGLGLGWWILVDQLYAARALWIAAVAPVSGIAAASFVAVLVTSAGERRNRRFVQEALGRYTSPALVAELTEHPEHLSLEWGERREMSVYFSDIAGFTSISEGLEPEKLVALLNEYLTCMTDIVLQHGGVVDKYIGDAIMAFWGAPLPDPEHARRAVLCALAMRKECERMRPEWEKKYGERIAARAGVNSGDAVVGNMGSAHKYNYTVMGDMVNLAARLEGANKPYGTELMISETALELVGDAVVTRELDLLTVKGKEQPVRVYEVLDLPGEVEPALARAAERFAAGLERYRSRDFAGAITELEAALAERPDDGPSKIYIERCRHFLAEPPPADWDGVWRLTSK